MKCSLSSVVSKFKSSANKKIKSHPTSIHNINSRFESSLFFVLQFSEETIQTINHDPILDIDTKDVIKYLVLKVVRDPLDCPRFIILHGQWKEAINLTEGCIVSTSANFKVENLVFENRELNSRYVAHIENYDDSFVIYPHFLLNAKSIADSTGCMRLGFLRVLHNPPESGPTYWLIKLLRMYIVEVAKNGENKKPKKQILEELIRRHREEIYYSGIDEEALLTAVSKKISTDVDYELTPDLTLDSAIQKTTKTALLPRLLREDGSLKSYSLGLRGNPTFIGVTADDEPIAVDVFEKTNNLFLKPNDYSRMVSIMHILSVGDWAPDKNAEIGMIWFTSPDSRFFIKPSAQEMRCAMMQRNRLVTHLVDNDIPPIEVKPICRVCRMSTVCRLYDTMLTKQPRADLMDRLVDSRVQFGTLRQQEFFSKAQLELQSELISNMRCCTRISMEPLSVRIAERTAATDLTVSENDMELSQVVLSTNHFGLFYGLNVRHYSMVIITRNGKLPVIGNGFVTSITEESITIKMDDLKAEIGETVTADFYDWTGQFKVKAGALTDLFLRQGGESLLARVIIFGEEPYFNTCEVEVPPTMNQSQREAVIKAVRAESYALIDAPKGTRWIDVVIAIVQNCVRQKRRILIAPFFHDTIGYIGKLLQSYGVDFVVSGTSKFVTGDLSQQCDTNIFASYAKASDAGEVILSKYVFLAPAIKATNMVRAMTFDLALVLESTMIPSVLTALPVLSSAKRFVLFGDPCLQPQRESLFSEVSKHHPTSVIALRELYDVDVGIAEALKCVYGMIKTNAVRMTVDYSPLKLMGRRAQFMRAALSLNNPVVFINAPFKQAIIHVLIAASLIFNKVTLTAPPGLLPELCYSVYRLRAESFNYIKPEVSGFIGDAAKRIKTARPESLNQRQSDVIICADMRPGADDSLLRTALSSARKKIVFIGNWSEGNGMPVWSSLVNGLPSDCMMLLDEEKVRKYPYPLIDFDAIFS